MEEITKIIVFIFNSFVHIWPYLLITIPFAVGIQLSGASRYIGKALGQNAYAAIVLATVMGALSPFCSCGVIPVITTLLIGGVPLAPVMSFWIASPSMDPEIFMLSVAAIGWKLSVWRLSATFIISLSAGFITLIVVKKGFIGNEILRINYSLTNRNSQKSSFRNLYDWMNKYAITGRQRKGTVQLLAFTGLHKTMKSFHCCVTIIDSSYRANPLHPGFKKDCSCETTAIAMDESFVNRLIKETWKALAMVIKFMAIAFFINALIAFYLPGDFMTRYLGGNSPLSVLIAAVVGIPLYTSNITALPVISGLLKLGMNEGAALSFLIAGPVTTLPAMMAVWGIVRPKVFFIYLAFAFSGAVIFGYLYNFIN